MFCSKCGRELSENANFCRYCGVFVKDNFIDKTEITERDFNTNINDDVLHNISFAERKNDVKTINIKRNENDISVFGIVALVFGIIGASSLVILFLLGVSSEFHKELINIFPIYFMINLVLNTIALYMDKNFNRTIITFYINITALLFLLVYFCYGSIL